MDQIRTVEDKMSIRILFPSWHASIPRVIDKNFPFPACRILLSMSIFFPSLRTHKVCQNLITYFVLTKMAGPNNVELRLVLTSPGGGETNVCHHLSLEVVVEVQYGEIYPDLEERLWVGNQVSIGKWYSMYDIRTWTFEQYPAFYHLPGHLVIAVCDEDGNAAFLGK